MFNEQDYIREQVKQLKWQEDITYKSIAVELLDMNYNSFLNFLHGYKQLGKARLLILKDYINNMLE